ncbi:mitochondrial import inner membrane translocase subunit Tim29 isoform X1 [Sander lucioperca]|uniref:Translocase of inner mitochondrial membrane 29 n=1 Tax=Sander lucioperca TaxID=283035 RepID=A0A8D0D668_SANLU|nr:mitochondrial import inner membrane translocase subunit Tim29 isoform X1 [Sander lucioperca]
MASLRVARRMFCAAAETAAAPVTSSRWERLKNSKAGSWCRGLLSDYKEACREVVVGSWEQPVKASVYVTLLGGAWACFYTKPDRSSFDATLLEFSNQLGLLSPWIRNGTSDGHVQSLVKLRNEGRLRHASLGLLSLVYRADYDADATLYEAQCSNLSVPWRELPKRILDVGFIGRWWVLDSKMKNFDVNEDEFKNLPAHMQATSPPGVQEVERSERLHKESWLALTMEEEEKEPNAVDRKEESVSEESQTQALKEEQTQA